MAPASFRSRKAKGWEIERSAPGGNGSTCLMSKSYKDLDAAAVNALIFGLADDQAIMTFIYEHWTWDKNEKVRVPLMLDKRVAIARHTWTGDGTSLTTTVPATLVPQMLAAKKMILKLDGADGDFDLAGFPEAYESLRRCDAALIASAPAPTMPSEARIKTYYLGALIEAAIEECDVATTGRQRTAFDSKIQVLRKEMGPIEPEIAKAVAGRAEPRCPGEKDKAKFQLGLEDFIETSPEDFATVIDRRTAEDPAGTATPKL